MVTAAQARHKTEREFISHLLYSEDLKMMEVVLHRQVIDDFGLLLNPVDQKPKH
jgi:hypothetical protein